MARPAKKLDDDKLHLLISLSAMQEKQKDIATQIGVSLPTLRSLQLRYNKEIEEQASHLEGVEQPVKKNEQKKGFLKPTKEMEAKEKAKEKPKEDPIMPQTDRKFMNKGSEFLSKQLEAQLKEALAGSRVLLKAQALYQSSLDTMNISWEDFLNYAVKSAYMDIEEAYEEALERYISEKRMYEFKLDEMENEEIAPEMEEIENE
jgi:predicted lipase